MMWSHYLAKFKRISFSLLVLFTLSSPTATTQAATPQNWTTLIPYGYFRSYEYAGEHNGAMLEFGPDENKIYQITLFKATGAVTYVYQIQEDGLYQLACFEEYDKVTDNRHSFAASDGKRSKEIPDNLAVGTQFYSGFDNEVLCTVVGNSESYTIDQTQYSDVIKIQHRFADKSIKYYYYAPYYGLIAIEDQNGTPELTLLAAQKKVN